MKRPDIYVTASILAFLLSSWYVGSAIRTEAAATQDLAAAIDCVSPYEHHKGWNSSSDAVYVDCMLAGRIREDRASR
jgi:hypothetical protein